MCCRIFHIGFIEVTIQWQYPYRLYNRGWQGLVTVVNAAGNGAQIVVEVAATPVPQAHIQGVLRLFANQGQAFVPHLG